MKAWDSIESLAEDVGVSTRTGFRWLKSGRIKRKQSGDGHLVFVMAGEPIDIDMTTDMSATDINSVSIGGEMSSDADRKKYKERLGHHLQSPKKVIPVEHPSERVIKQRENVEMAELEVRKEKAVRQLERLSESKKKEDVERIKMIERKVWLGKWIAYALHYFSFSFPIPLDWKVKVKKAVEESLADVSVNEDPDSVWIMIQEIMDDLRESYCEKVLYPEAKKELINDSIRSLRFPMWVRLEVEDDIRTEIHIRMEETFTGGEMPEEYFEAAKRIKDEILNNLSRM